MKLSGILDFKTPLVVAVFSVIISEMIYLSIAYFILDNVDISGIIFSFIIPAVISYPIANTKQKQIKKINEQKEELEHLNKINKRLFSTIAHDIRSPIASASMLIDLTLSDTLSPEESKEQLEDVSSNITVLLAFLDDLLVWSKKQIEKEPLKPELFSTEELLLQHVELYRKIISQKGINLKLGNIDSSLFIDKGSYSFVIRNLLHNAIKYTPENGFIEISVDEEEQFIRTVIKDTGIGMPEKKVESILSKKDYSSSEGTKNEKGTGFGLKTAIEYLEEQNARIEIESSLNKGTKVSVLVPKTFHN
ncbi:MAG: sensor histidine kinase [Balneola sp.]